MGWRDSSVLEAVPHKDQEGNVGGIEIPCNGIGILTAHVVAADSWDGTITFQGTNDKKNWASIQGQQVDDGSVTTTATGTSLNMLYRFDVSAFDQFRALIAGRSTGSVTVTVRGVPA